MTTQAFLAALDPTTDIFDFRAFHDRERGRDGIAMRGRFSDLEPRMRELNASGYGIHVMINATDGQGRSIANVTHCRAQLTDLDKGDIPVNYGRIITANPLPHAVVNTSPGKYQVWHFTKHHADKQLFTDTQRRLAAHYQGDEQFIDVAHTARLPGFYHIKADPYLVTLYSGPAWGSPAIDPWAIAAPLMHIPVSGGSGDRKPFGEPSLAGPSVDWCTYCLNRIDPNSLGFWDWIAVTAAFKQAISSLTTMDQAYQLWLDWCVQHRKNDLVDNLKQWSHINATQSGWKALLKQSNCEGEWMAAQSRQALATSNSPIAVLASSDNIVGNNGGAATPELGSYLTPADQSAYFQGCYWIENLGRILTPRGRLMDQNKFNGTYGGKTFQTSNLADAKTTKSPWEAALSGLAYTVPKMDHMRFLPWLPFGAVVEDELSRKGVNTYRPITTVHAAGDISRWTDHLARILPYEQDRDIINGFMAFCVQYPGIKAGWGPIIQSMEGAGKTAFWQIMSRAVGEMYTHLPKAEQLVEGGGKFNAWMRNKLMIIVNEIRVDGNDKRDLVEILKPLITDKRVEVEGKGIDQEMFDNVTNWLMFTNHKDAIPITTTSRRFCIMYTAIQTINDLERAGMNGDYFNSLYTWLDQGGASAVVEWLGRYVIPDHLHPLKQATRAPHSTSYGEALVNSRSALEAAIMEAVDGNMQGFRGGWISSTALAAMLRDRVGRIAAPRSVAKALENLGYHKIGKSTHAYFQENSKLQSYLYNLEASANMHNYGKLQGYE